MSASNECFQPRFELWEAAEHRVHLDLKSFRKIFFFKGAEGQAEGLAERLMELTELIHEKPNDNKSTADSSYVHNLLKCVF